MRNRKVGLTSRILQFLALKGIYAMRDTMRDTIAQNRTYTMRDND